MVELVTVLVVEDGDLDRVLQSAAGTDGALFIPSHNQRHALNTCCALEPACVVVSHHPPTVDAVWLVSSIRAQPTAVAAVPIVVLQDDARAAQDQGFAFGADVILPRSTQPRALLNQVNALITLVERIRERGEASPSTHPRADVALRALHGSLERTSVSTVLALLELQRASGELWLARGPRDQRGLVVELASGAVIGGHTPEAQLAPLDAVNAAVHWGPGLFDFVQGPPRPPPTNATSMTSLLVATLGGVDENEVELAPTARYMPGERPPPAACAAQPSGRSGLRVKVSPAMSRQHATRDVNRAKSGAPLPREESDEPVTARRR